MIGPLTRWLAAALALTVPAADAAQAVYRYRDDGGQLQYADRPPADGRTVEVRPLRRQNLEPVVRVLERTGDNGTELVAVNEYHCPVEFVLELYDPAGNVVSHSGRLVLAARTEAIVHTIDSSLPRDERPWRYAYRYLLGDPAAQHDDTVLYRPPFAAGQSFPVTQAWPDALTHGGGSAHAIDFAMPQGTAVHAARAGTVVEIAYKSYRGGTSADDAGHANIVRVLHEDGTFATYAHLALNSIRVRPGDLVVSGQIIAASGNTGFSSGPHLHFAVERNTGFALESVPVRFTGRGGVSQSARTGSSLHAH